MILWQNHSLIEKKTNNLEGCRVLSSLAALRGMIAITQHQFSEIRLLEPLSNLFLPTEPPCWPILPLLWQIPERGGLPDPSFQRRTESMHTCRCLVLSWHILQHRHRERSFDHRCSSLNIRSPSAHCVGPVGLVGPAQTEPSEGSQRERFHSELEMIALLQLQQLQHSQFGSEEAPRPHASVPSGVMHPFKICQNVTASKSEEKSIGAVFLDFLEGDRNTLLKQTSVETRIYRVWLVSTAPVLK